MILPALMLMTQAGLPGPGSPPSVPALATRAEAKQAVVACGVPAASVEVRDEPSMQEDIVSVGLLPEPPSPTILACVADASLRTVYYVFFSDPTLQQRYEGVYAVKERAFGQAQARGWLAQRGLLATSPLPVAGESAATYAAKVEQFCGIRERTLLIARDAHFITIAPNGLGHVTKRGIEGAAATNDQFECVLNVTAAADLEAHGMFFGFIGNAAPASTQ